MSILPPAALAAALAIVACRAERAEPPRDSALGAGAAAGGASAAGPARDAGLPPNAIQVSLHLLAGFDDEGIIERAPALDSVPGPYRVGGDVYADAAGVVAAVEPGATVSTAGGRLVLRGDMTAIPVRLHGAGGTVPYAPVRAVARALHAHLAVHPESLSATLWPGARLCEYRERFGRPGARVYDGAQAEGLFERCGKPARR